MFSHRDAKWPFVEHPLTDMNPKEDVAGREGGHGQRSPMAGKSATRVEKLPPPELRARAIKEVQIAESLTRVPIMPAAPGPVYFQIGILETLRRQLLELPNKTNLDQKLIQDIGAVLRKLQSRIGRSQVGLRDRAKMELQKPEEEGQDKNEEEKEQEEHAEQYEQDLLLQRTKAEEAAERDLKKKIESLPESATQETAKKELVEKAQAKEAPKDLEAKEKDSRPGK